MSHQPDGVRELTPADLRAAAALHARELPEGFFAQLGPGFLRHYLATFLDVPGGVRLAVEDEHGMLVGFLVGSTRDGHHRQALRRHGRTLALAALLSLLRRPAVLLQFLRTRAMRYARTGVRAVRGGAVAHETGAGTGRPVAGRTAVLLHVAVAPSARGRGVGAALVRGLETAARRDGCRRAVLVAFGDKAFYERVGWQRVSARRTDTGQDVVTYRREL